MKQAKPSKELMKAFDTILNTPKRDEETRMTDEEFQKANLGLCEGCYADPCECLPDDANCDPE